MATNDDNKPSFFARYIDNPPPIKQPHKIQHAQKLLDWLQRWSKPTVTVRDIHIYGPRPRDRESTLSSAKILVENGWLNPIQARRYDGHIWQVLRRPVVRPDVVR